MREPTRGLPRRALLAWLAAASLPAWSNLEPGPEVAAVLPGARLQGSGRLTAFGFHVYDIRLWVSEGFAADAFAQRPLAIEIEYARSFAGQRMAERSLDEMRRIAALTPEQRAAWGTAMRQAFPDVSKGDRLIGIHRPGEGVRFLHNGALRADVDDPEFAPAFFAIWLSPKTSEPKLRRALLGPGA